jgi:hypothetical protein
MDDPEAISEVARTALGLMHFENIDAAVSSGDADLLAEKADEACVRGCYRCLLSYFNQPDHEQIDRGSGEVTQLLVDLARGRTVLEKRVAPGGASSPWLKAFEDAGLPHADTIGVSFAGAEAEFVWRGHFVAATSQAVTADMATEAGNKGWELVALPASPDIGVPKELLDLLKG